MFVSLIVPKQKNGGPPNLYQRQKDQIAQQQARISDLEQAIGRLEANIASLASKVNWYEEQIRLAAHRRFAPSSERTPVGQIAFLFNEAEVAAAEEEAEPAQEEETQTLVPRKKKTKGHRQRQLALLETREIEYPLEGELICGCGNAMHFVDWQVTEKVDVEPAMAIRVLHKQPVYACRDCQSEGEPAPIKTIQTMPEDAFPKSIASPSLVAQIATQKFVMGSPLYRQEQHFEGLGVFISRQTMANWMIQAAKVLGPMNERLHELLVLREVLHADETDVQVLKEPGRAATTTSTMWLYRSGFDGPHIVLFDYQTTRAGKNAKEFLTGFGGFDPATKTIPIKKYLQVDGYAGYETVPHWIIRDNQKIPDVILAGCWAHVRRKFVDALAVLKKEERSADNPPIAQQGLDLVNALFRVERELKGATANHRLTVRKARSEPIVKQLKEWLDKHVQTAAPKSGFGKAIAYALGEWNKLTVFLTDGRVELDNNHAERSIKPFVIGRKNWLFANAPSGASASAVIYSIVATAMENGLVPFEYLKFLFEQLPNTDRKDSQALDRLLPWCGTLPERCRKSVTP